MMIKKIKNDQELEMCINDIQNRLSYINHYLQEWEVLMNFCSKDNGEKYNEYRLFFKYVRKAYLDMVFLNLSIIFDGGSIPNIYRVNEYISNKSDFVKRLSLYWEFKDISEDIKNIRNKAVAHIDDVHIENIYRRFKVSKTKLDNILYYLDKRLECLIKHSGIDIVKNELIYLDNEGMKSVLEHLPRTNPNANTARGIRLKNNFEYTCELFE